MVEFKTYTGNEYGNLVITVAGKEDAVPPGNYEIVGLRYDQSFLAYLMSVPRTVNIQLYRPEGADDWSWNRFQNMVQGAILSRNVSLKSISAEEQMWIENAILNYELLKHRECGFKTTRDLLSPEHEAIAYIIGNGPSFRNDPVFWEETVFASLAVEHKLDKDPDYLGHMDAICPKSFTSAHGKPSLIISPTVSPKVLSYFPSSEVFLYCGQERLINGIMGKLLRVPDEAPICGTVTHMLTLAAIQAGFKNICLVGVDLAALHPDKNDFGPDDPSLKEVVNQFGNTCYTNSFWMACKSGFENLAVQHKDINFYNDSRIGLDITGFKPTKSTALS